MSRVVADTVTARWTPPPAPPPPVPLPRGLLWFAAWVALCRVDGGALQVGWWCVAARVQLCRVSDRILTCLGPMGASQETRRDPRGKAPQRARQRAATRDVSGVLKLNALVRSPTTARSG